MEVAERFVTAVAAQVEQEIGKPTEWIQISF
jgi:hypothetical protein